MISSNLLLPTGKIIFMQKKYWIPHAIKRRKKVLINFSPVFNGIGLKDLAGWILEDNLPVRLQIQLHKYIWGENARGV